MPPEPQATSFIFEMFKLSFVAVLASFITGRVLWQWQKENEMKHKVFNQAAEALAHYFADCLDPELKREKTKELAEKDLYKPFTNSTAVKLEKATSLVRAYFSKEAAETYFRAANAFIPLNDNQYPIGAFKLRDKAIYTLKSELNIGVLRSLMPLKFCGWIKSKWVRISSFLKRRRTSDSIN